MSQKRSAMLRIIFLTSLFIALSCTNKNMKTTNIAIIRGESLNYRVEEDEPAPYESKVALECLELQTRPQIKFYSRNRALELFQSGQVDIVVSGQASSFPKNLIPYTRIKEGTKAAILYKDKASPLANVFSIPNGTSTGVLENSSFVSSFIMRTGDIKLTVFRNISEAVEALKKDKIDCLVIDQIAIKHISHLVPEVNSRVLDLPSSPVIWLYR